MRRARLRPATAILWLMAALVTQQAAFAGGPRFVAGQPYFTGVSEGTPIGWRQSTLLYSTDPGPLSASVNHQAADALVASAAAVWNVPVASITVAQGTPLAEDVSGQNVYLSSTGVVFPADVMSSNAAAVPLAIVYDADGAVTDTLLGSGASSPSSCRQNAVTETVDSFDPAGYILHAIIIINGRCTGPAPQQQLQLQYQLERVFGRVLGLAWSQTNDNVYTGTPTPTAQQALNWPILHPLDILCGLYTYQCLPQPFTLRPDDIASLVAVYPNQGGSTLPAGKVVSLASALGEFVSYRFPSGQAMAGVNMLAQITPSATNVAQPWMTASSVTGTAFRRADTSPFVTQDQSPAGSFGMHDANGAANALFTYLPTTDPTRLTGVTLTTEPINPLYTGAYALATNALGEVAPSGSSLQVAAAYQGAGGTGGFYFVVADAAAACGNGADGSLYAPAPMPPTGWWTGQTCAYGHVSYVQASLRANRSFTVEVTALDANGLATTAKLRPVLGLYAPGDYWAAPPTAGVATQAFQALTIGTTTLTATTAASPNLTLAIADQRGGGRPDFNYQARVFYADSISPAIVPAAGAQAVITGLGFRPGNVVTINGVGAQVTAWTANSITLTLPTLTTARATSGIAADVTVSDLGTGAITTMTGAVTYLSSQTPPPTLRLLSAPAGTLFTGTPAATLFTVQELAADGVTPIINEPITLTLSNPAAASAGLWSVCGAPICTVTTDANGKASSLLTATQPGTLSMTASDAHSSLVTVSSSVTTLTPAGSMLTVTTPMGTFYNTQPAGTFAVQVLSAAQGSTPGTPLANRSVTFSVTAGSAQLGTCAAMSCIVTTDGNGMAQVSVTPESIGGVTLQAADGQLTQSASLNVKSWADILSITAAPGNNAVAGTIAGYFKISLMHGDGTTADPGQTVRLTTSTGVYFSSCGTATCTLTTDGGGTIQQLIGTYSAGTYTLTATYGSASASATFTVLSAAPHLQLISSPATPVPVGTQATTPLTVRLLDAFGNPFAGQQVLFAVPAQQAWISPCGRQPICGVQTAADGTASILLTPLVGALIGIDISSAQAAPINVSFSGVGALRTLTVVQQPGSAGAPLNQTQNIVIRAVGPDGVTPAANEQIDIVTLSGQISFRQCEISYCRSGTDQNGLATFFGTPIAPGLITLEVFDEASPLNLLTFSFEAIVPPDVLRIVSAPASGAVVGLPAAVPFAVRVYAPDGITAQAGRAVALSLAGGAAGFNACAGASACVLQTNSTGMIASTITPAAAGQIALQAAEGGGTVTAVFNAVNPPPDQMLLVSAPLSGAVAGHLAAPAFAVRLLSADGVTPAAGRAVTLAVAGGQAVLTACGQPTCIVTSAADGSVASNVQPLAAGLIALLASEVSSGQIVSLATSFTAVAAPDLLVITQAPPAEDLIGTAVTFTVQALLADGVTPAVGKPIIFLSTAGATLSGCTAAPCTITSGPTGLATVSITPTLAGQVTVTAGEGSASVSTSFTAISPPPPPPPPPPPVLPDQLIVLSAPTGSSPINAPNGTVFAIEIIGADGVSPAAGRSITFATTAGQATLSACLGAATCTLLTGSNGTAATSVTPTAAGLITITLSEAGVPANTASASFTAIAPPVQPPPIPAQQLTIVSTPGTSVFAGMTAAVPFAVRLTLTDGVTPVAGVPVTFATAGAGNAQYVVCGAPVCTVITDSTGLASTAVTGVQAGAVTLSAVAPSPGAGLPAPSVSTTLQVVADQVSLIAATPRIFVAEAATLTLTLSAQSSENGSPAAGIPVLWTATPGVTLGLQQTTSAADGSTSLLASLPPLRAGAHAVITACAQFTGAGSACANFTITGVAANQFTVAIVSGGLQQISAAASPNGYAPVLAEVLDAAADPIAGAAVTIYQTVTAPAGPCPPMGRCPAAPVIAQQVSAGVTDATGTISIPPLTLPLSNQLEQTQIAISVGSNGFAATILTASP